MGRLDGKVAVVTGAGAGIGQEALRTLTRTAAREWRDALRASFATSLAAVGVTILQVGTHVIDLVDADHATGTQYSAGQVEDQGRWIHQAIVYRDVYERRDGRWLFVRRVHELFHGVEAWTNPLDQAPADWPRHADGRGTAPGSFPTWETFWRVDAPGRDGP